MNTLLTALDVLADDHIAPPRTGRGHRPELICLAVAQIMLGYHNERRWVRHVHATAELIGMFPDMLSQSGYHRRHKAGIPRSVGPEHNAEPGPGRDATAGPQLTGERTIEGLTSSW
jgi:hypothetical protein